MNNKLVLVAAVILLIAAAVWFRIPRESKPLSKTPAVGTDICNEFPQEFIAKTLGKTIINTEKHDSQTTHVCQYYTDETNFVTIRANALNVEDQKKGQVALGRSIATNASIPSDHFVVTQENGLINQIVLVINPNLFVAVDRTSTQAATEAELVSLAAQIAQRIQNGENTASPSQASTPTSASVPLPQEEDVMRSFFSAIGEHRPSDAVAMMAPTSIPDENTKQAWAVQFNAFQSLTIKSMSAAPESEWSDTKHTYKVVLEVQMKPEAENAPIPFYGYDNGENTRWVLLEKIGDDWKIVGIVTGP